MKGGSWYAMKLEKVALLKEILNFSFFFYLGKVINRFIMTMELGKTDN